MQLLIFLKITYNIIISKIFFTKEILNNHIDPLNILRDNKTNLNEEEAFIINNICGYFILEN